MLTALAGALGSTDPHSTAVHVEPFSTSVFKDLTWIFATTTKICTSGSSSWVHTQSLQRNHYDPLTRHFMSFKKKKEMTAEYRWPAPAPSIFRASWFGRWVVTHSLADSDFHGHRPAVCINQHLLWGLDERAFWHRISAFGSSHIASSAYQKWPTWSLYSTLKFN